MIDFDTYIKMGEPGGKERAEAWKTGQKGVQPGSLKRCEAVFECLEIVSDSWRAVQDSATAQRIKERLIGAYIVNNKV